MPKSQEGLSTIILIIGLVIVILIGFIAFKLYIEPSKIPNEKKESPSQEVIQKDSFSQTQPEPSPAPESQSLANPASENCVKEGGILKIMKNGSGAEFGLCQFEDDQSCEEWALMRGECPKGGIKTIGYDNDQQAYCAWLGGRTTAVENAVCELPNGKDCPVDELWSGTCN